MSLEDFIKQLRKAAGRGNNGVEVKFYQYDELCLASVTLGSDGNLILGFGKPLAEGWEEDYVLDKMAAPLPVAVAAVEERVAEEEEEVVVEVSN